MRENGHPHAPWPPLPLHNGNLCRRDNRVTSRTWREPRRVGPLRLALPFAISAALARLEETVPEHLPAVVCSRTHAAMIRFRAERRSVGGYPGASGSVLYIYVFSLVPMVVTCPKTLVAKRYSYLLRECTHQAHAPETIVTFRARTYCSIEKFWVLPIASLPR